MRSVPNVAWRQNIIGEGDVVDQSPETVAPGTANRRIPVLGELCGPVDCDLSNRSTVLVANHAPGVGVVGNSELMPVGIGDVEPMRCNDATIVLDQIEVDVAVV